MIALDMYLPLHGRTDLRFYDTSSNKCINVLDLFWHGYVHVHCTLFSRLYLIIFYPKKKKKKKKVSARGTGTVHIYCIYTTSYRAETYIGLSIYMIDLIREPMEQNI